MANSSALELTRVHRIAILVGLLVGLAILLVTPDASAVSPFGMLGLALCVAVYGYFKSRVRQPWECNDEPWS